MILSNLNIRSKLNLGFGTLVALTFLVTGFSTVGSITAQQNIDRTQRLRVPAALTSADAQTNLLKMSANLRGYLATGRSEFRNLFQQSRQDFEADLAYIETLWANNNETTDIQQLHEVKALYKKWLVLPDQLFLLRDNPIKNQPALGLLHEQGEMPISVILTEVTRMLEEQEKKNLSAEDIIVLKHLIDFKSAFSLQISALRGYLTNPLPGFRYDYTMNANASEAVWKALNRLRPSLTATQQASLNKIAQAQKRFLPLPAQMFKAVEGKRNREDLFIFQTQAEPLVEDMLALLGELVVNEQTSLTSDLQVSYQRLRTAQIQLMIASLIALILAVSLAMLLRRQIANPIKRLTTVTTKIAQGDLQARATVETRDEIGILAETFNQMTESLQRSQQELQEYSYTLEQRVENRTLELQQKNGELQQTLKELHKTQAQLIQTEKMSSLGQLVAGVAHEINNPVNFIHGNTAHINHYVRDIMDLLQIYQKSYPEPTLQVIQKAEEIDLEFLLEDFPKILSSVQVGTERIRDIVQSLRIFSRLDEAEVKTVDIHEGIDSTLMILHNRLKAKPNQRGIEVVKQYGNLPKVECYAGQINQVFMNILANAIDALEEKMHQEMDEAQASFQPVITIQTESLASNQIQIRIRDNGPGIPELVQKQLFDPFFTTKAVGKGTGLGMSISHQIITEKHGGSLTCLSRLREGAEFIIQIPVHQMLTTTIQ